MARTYPNREFIIGVVGLKASGKDVLCERLARSGFDVQSTSRAVHAECVRQGIAEPTVAQMQDLADQQKRIYQDYGLWTRRAIEAARANGSRLIAVNCLRHPAEVAAIEDQDDAGTLLIGVTAPTRIRAARLIARARPGDPQVLEEFMNLDDRDRGIGEPPTGQQVDRTLALVPHRCVYNNAGTLGAFHHWITDLLAWYALPGRFGTEP
jgi:dephospho-CoA kinase